MDTETTEKDFAAKIKSAIEPARGVGDRELRNSFATRLKQVAARPDVVPIEFNGERVEVRRGGTLLGNPRHYRDPHTEGVMEQAFGRVPRADVYRQTGLQFMRFNSLFQLLALHRDRSPLLDMAENLLFMPDLFHYFFTGIKVNEFTNTTTSQLGYFAAGYSANATPSPGSLRISGGQALPILVAILIVLVVVAGIPLAIVRRRRSGGEVEEDEDEDDA